MEPSGEFYEPDEPVERVVQAFEQGDKQLTAAPSRGITQTLNVGYPIVAGSRGHTEYLHVPGTALTLISERPTTTAGTPANGLTA